MNRNGEPLSDCWPIPWVTTEGIATIPALASPHGDVVRGISCPDQPAGTGPSEGRAGVWLLASQVVNISEGEETGKKEIDEAAKSWAKSCGFTVTKLCFPLGDIPKWGGG